MKTTIDSQNYVPNRFRQYLNPPDYNNRATNYMDLSDFPSTTLTTDEETYATLRGDEGREELVLHNMREAFFYARKCARGNLLDGEVLSACYLALVDAAKNFKPNQIRFFAYAKPYVRGRVISEFRSQDVVRKVRTCEALPETVFGDEVYSANEAHFVEPDLDANHAREIVSILGPVMDSKLSEKEKMVLELHFKGGLNYRQIGDLLSVSRSDIQHTASVALGKLRAELSRRKLTPDAL